jgi:hypothetical protein
MPFTINKVGNMMYTASYVDRTLKRETEIELPGGYESEESARIEAIKRAQNMGIISGAQAMAHLRHVKHPVTADEMRANARKRWKGGEQDE